MNEIELKFPDKNDKKRVMEYLEEHYENGEYSLNGVGGLDRLNDFEKWLEKIQNDLSRKTEDKEKVPATLYLAITCYKENIGSKKTILANGGKLENEIHENEKTIQRYWIDIEE